MFSVTALLIKRYWPTEKTKQIIALSWTLWQRLVWQSLLKLLNNQSFFRTKSSLLVFLPITPTYSGFSISSFCHFVFLEIFYDHYELPTFPLSFCPWHVILKLAKKILHKHGEVLANIKRCLLRFFSSLWGRKTCPKFVTTLCLKLFEVRNFQKHWKAPLRNFFDTVRNYFV